jgi:peptidoglycan L-alanyl-D-glutamate endopeptidase CwlK
MERMKGVDSDLQIVFHAALDDSPIDFGIPAHGGRRTPGEQNELFIQNLSKCDGFNTKSKHQSGNALDFYAYVNGKASWDKVHLAMVASCILTTAKRLKIEGLIDSELEWGGTFDSNSFDGWDMPHIAKKS